MADPKKDSIRIPLPARPEQAADDPNAEKYDSARIVLPSRPPVTSIRRLPPKITPALSSSSLLQPLPKPPETETARISVLPRPGPVPVAPVVTPRPVAPVDAIPRSLAWGLLIVSAVIFLIQIWNYVVS